VSVFFIITIMPKIVDHEERRRAIASAAVDAIAANGLEGVKLADIAAAAGVTTGAIAHYFPDKDAVLAAALEEVCTRIFLEMGPPDGPLQVGELADVMPVTPEKRAEWKVWLAYWGRAPQSETLRAIHAQYYSDIEQAVATDLDGHVEDAGLVASAVMAAVDGVGTRATLEPEAWPAERQMALLEALLGNLLPKADRPDDFS